MAISELVLINLSIWIVGVPGHKTRTPTRAWLDDDTTHRLEEEEEEDLPFYQTFY